MGYTLEISFDLLNRTADDIHTKRDALIDLALASQCDHHYTLYETQPPSNDGGAASPARHHEILVVHFLDDDDSLFSCAAFLRMVRKQSGLTLECIYEDNITCKLLYASRGYMQLMEPGAAQRFRREKRERSLSETEKSLLGEKKTNT